MNSLRDMPVSSGIARRRVMSAALGALAITSLTLMTSERAYATDTGTTLRLVPEPDDFYVPLPNELVLAAPRLLGGKLLVEGNALRGGSRLVIIWDDRLYQSGRPLLLQGKRRIKLESLSGEVRREDGRVQRTLRIDEDLDPGTHYSLRIGTGRTRNYPEDVVAGPLPTSIECQSTRGVASVESPTLQAAASSPVWGVLLGASWVPAHWGNGYHTWRPDFLTIRSAGPNAIPSGTSLRVQLDRRLFKNLSVRNLIDNSVYNKGFSHGQVIGISWPLLSGLEPGQRMTFQFLADAMPRHGEIPDLEPPAVTTEMSKSSVGQRVTGYESLTRTDSGNTKKNKEQFPLVEYSRAP